MKPSSGVLLGVLGFAGLLGPPAYAQLYKWTDEQGRTHYSDTAPDKGKAKPVEIKINSYTGPAVVSSSGKPAPGPSSKGRVKMLTTAWCGYCRQARAYLSGKGIPFEDLDVEKSAQGKQEYAALKGRGVPVILVGSQRMDGFEQAGLESMLRSAGH